MTEVDVLVTGADGFVGRAALGALSRAGIPVMGCDLPAEPDDLAAPYVQLDVRDKSETLAVLNRLRPRAVVHLAAALDVTGKAPQNVIETNVAGTSNVLTACLPSGVQKFVFGSSVMVYGPRSAASGEPVTEKEPLDPQTLYGASKVMVEHLLQEPFYRRELQTVALRFTTVYGPGRLRGGAYPQVVDVCRAALGEIVDIDTDQATDVIHASDAASAVVAAVSHDVAAGAYNIGHHRVRGTDLIAAARHVRGNIRAQEVSGTQSSWPSNIDCRRAHDELHWQPRTSLLDGIADAIKWFEQRAARDL